MVEQATRATRRLRLAAAAVLIAGGSSLSCPTVAHAHALYLFAAVEEGYLVGEAYYHGQIPAQHAAVIISAPDGRQFGKTTTDEEGRFRFAPTVHTDHHIRVETDDSHFATFTVTAAELGTDLDAEAPRSVRPANIDNELARLREQVVRLRQDLMAYEQTTRLRDIFGGIGYILGLGGLAAWLLSRQRGRSPAGRASGSE